MERLVAAMLDVDGVLQHVSACLRFCDSGAEFVLYGWMDGY
jgi:hypothetical protein